jgi:hypothetical protein
MRHDRPPSRLTTFEVGKEAVATAKRAPSGICPAEGGDQAAGIHSVDSCSRTRKCTESVSPSSSSPDRPPPKRLPGGRAFNLRRSVLGALGNLVRHSTRVKHVVLLFLANTDNPVSGEVFAADAAKTGRIHAEMHRGRCSLVRLSDRPPPKRLPVGEPSTSGAPSSVQSGDYDPRRPASSAIGLRFPHFATFSLQVAHTCVEPRVLYMGGTKVSPSRVRFRPLSRLTFRFRVRPSGRASSYSRPVLGAAAIYALQRAPARGSDDGKAANCERVGTGCTGSTS